MATENSFQRASAHSERFVGDLNTQLRIVAWIQIAYFQTLRYPQTGMNHSPQNTLERRLYAFAGDLSNDLPGFQMISDFGVCFHHTIRRSAQNTFGLALRHGFRQESIIFRRALPGYTPHGDTSIGFNYGMAIVTRHESRAQSNKQPYAVEIEFYVLFQHSSIYNHLWLEALHGVAVGID